MLFLKYNNEKELVEISESTQSAGWGQLVTHGNRLLAGVKDKDVESAFTCLVNLLSKYSSKLLELFSVFRLYIQQKLHVGVS